MWDYNANYFQRTNEYRFTRACLNCRSQFRILKRLPLAKLEPFFRVKTKKSSVTHWPCKKHRVSATHSLYLYESLKGTVTNHSQGQNPVTSVLTIPPPQRPCLLFSLTALRKYRRANSGGYCWSQRWPFVIRHLRLYQFFFNPSCSHIWLTCRKMVLCHATGHSVRQSWLPLSWLADSGDRHMTGRSKVDMTPSGRSMRYGSMSA